MDLATIFTGIGAAISAAGGIYLIVHEFRRKERKVTAQEIDELSRQLHETRHEVILYRNYVFSLQQMMADRGMDLPTPPE